MPEISRFLGLVIGMFYSEHGVPYFHAVYGNTRLQSKSRTMQCTARCRPGRYGSCLNGGSCIGQTYWRIGNWPGRASPSSQSRRWSRVRGMNYHVVEARHIRAHTVWLRFRDGTSGEIDLGPALQGRIMEPLKDVMFFKQSRFCTGVPARQRSSHRISARALVACRGASDRPIHLPDRA
jgi:hypothetical protein